MCRCRSGDYRKVEHENTIETVDRPGGGNARGAALAAPVSGNIVGRDSGRCLDVRGGPGQGANGTPIQIYDCLGAAQTNQLWYLY